MIELLCLINVDTLTGNRFAVTAPFAKNGFFAVPKWFLQNATRSNGGPKGPGTWPNAGQATVNRRFREGLCFRQGRSALAAGIPAVPADARQTLQVGRDRPLGSALIRRNASFGFRYLSPQLGDGFLGLAGSFGAGDLANRKPGGLQGLQGVAVPLELNPVPGNAAIAVGNHVNLLIRQEHSIRMTFLGIPGSTSCIRNEHGHDVGA
jgi:hypothetical protein